MTTDNRSDTRTLTTPLVSLIVVTYNSAAHLPSFFEALATTAYQPYEVLVVDNNSQDGTSRILAEQYPEVRLLANDTNLGFGRACNQGARAAQGDILVFLNPDVIITPEWLTILVRHLAQQPDTAILCPQTLYLDQQWTAHAVSPGAQALVAETAAVPGCAMLMPRMAWQALGGFDEQIFLYWEDIELCWRAWLLGWRVQEDLEAHIYHEHGGSAGGQHWDAEQTKNSLYTYLKLMRWHIVIGFVFQLAAKTVAKIVLRRQLALVGAWSWNFRHLGQTLAQRRAIADQRRGDPARLERMIAIHTRRGRKARQERGRMVYYRDGERYHASRPEP
jgi:N-acetylglucosaminyl-diphospho-decaprenol L-rhamnosyltransferase